MIGMTARVVKPPTLCADCGLALEQPAGRGRPRLIHPGCNRPDANTHSEGRLACHCWCQRVLLYVPTADIARGITRSCGRPGCKP